VDNNNNIYNTSNISCSSLAENYSDDVREDRHPPTTHMHFRISWLTSTLVVYDLIIWRESKERTERKDRRTPLLITTVDRWLYSLLSELVARVDRVPMCATCTPTNVRPSLLNVITLKRRWHRSLHSVRSGRRHCLALFHTAVDYVTFGETLDTDVSRDQSTGSRNVTSHVDIAFALSIHVITVSNEVRIFCTISIRTKI